MSDAWNFFDKVENETKVRCRKCNRVYKWNNSTSFMIKHIQGHHAAELQDIQNKKKDISNLRTLDKTNLHENADRSLVFAFCSSNVPFRFAKDEWFLDFCRNLDSNYKVLSPEQIVSRLKINSQNYKKEVMSIIRGMEKFYVTMDDWTKKHESVSIYAFFIYFIDTNMERKKIFLGTRKIDKAATTANVGQVLSEILQNYKIDFANLIGGITDGASNLTSFFERNSKYHLHCAAHSLALIVKAASQQKTMSSVFDKIMKFAEHLSRSQQDRDLLRELSPTWNIKNALPLPFSSTRWGAAVLMAQRFKTHYECILSTGKFQHFLLTDEERERLDMFVAVASPYLVAITKAEADYTFSSEIIIQYASLYKFISGKKEQTRCHLVSTLFNETKKRFLSYLSNDMILFAIYCDARFAYYEDVLVDTTWDYIESSVINYCESICYISDDSSSGEPPEKRHTDNNEYDVMSDFLDSQETLQCTGSVKSQIASYKATVLSGRPSRKSSPLEFWRTNGKRFPSLLMLARHSLSPPQSSAVVERLFSKYGEIVSSSKRNRLSAGTINDMLLNSALATLKKEKRKSSDTTFTSDDDFEGFQLEFDVEKEKMEEERTEKEKIEKQNKCQSRASPGSEIIEEELEDLNDETRDSIDIVN